MKTTRKSVKIVALMLFIVMSLSSLFGCAQLFEDILSSDKNNNSDTNTGVNDNVETPGDTTADGGNNTVNGDNGTHSHIFGDWTVIKNATNTEDGLQERKCDCGAVEQQTIPASNKEYTITYSNLKSADYPTVNGYNSSEGLLNLPVIESEGYRFIGWYTSSIGGNIVDYIPKGSTGDYVLFAHWELVNYEITYKNVPDNTNPTSYNIESSLKLTTPTWRGLEFTHWSDQNGNTYTPDQNITFMPKAITGDLVLTANWKVLRNLATPASDTTLHTVYSEEEGLIYFYYDLGTIQHVVLDDINPSLYYKTEGMPMNLTLSNTVTISNEKAESISNTISQSISQTDSWASSYSKSETHSENWNKEIDAGLEAGIGGGKEKGGSIGDGKIGASIKKLFNWSVKAHVDYTYGWGENDTTSETWGSSESHSSTTSESYSKSVVSSLAYKEQISSEIVESYSINAELPSGYYAYVHAGNVRVIGIVTYEVGTGYLYLNTYCYLDNMHSMIMYYADVNQLNNPSVEGLDFNIPEEEIINIVDNSYYVRYDANGGEGTMPTTLHSVNGSEKLAKNTFTKAGCTFAGWELTTADGVSILLDEQSVTNLAAAHQVVVLKAKWTSTEPIWVEKGTATNYYIKPATQTGYDKDNEICAKYNNEKLESGIDGNTKIVVTEEKFYTYVYWHWATSNNKTGDIIFGDYKGEILGGKPAIYFVAFESTQNYGKTDANGTTDKYTYYCNHSNTDGSWWWHRFEVYIQTYTIYENINPIS